MTWQAPGPRRNVHKPTSCPSAQNPDLLEFAHRCCSRDNCVSGVIHLVQAPGCLQHSSAIVCLSTNSKENMKHSGEQVNTTAAQTTANTGRQKMSHTKIPLKLRKHTCNTHSHIQGNCGCEPWETAMQRASAATGEPVLRTKPASR